MNLTGGGGRDYSDTSAVEAVKVLRKVVPSPGDVVAVSNLKMRFTDGIAAPADVVLRLTDDEFIDIANNVFCWDEALVMSNVLSLSERSLEFRLNYVADVSHGEKWRKLRLRFDGIEDLDFACRDATLGWPHSVVRHVNLEYAVRSQSELLPKILALLWQDHTGAELAGMAFESHPSTRFGGHNAPLAGTVWINWEPPVGDLSPIRIERIECRGIEIQFLSPAANKPWTE